MTAPFPHSHIRSVVIDCTTHTYPHNIEHVNRYPMRRLPRPVHQAWFTRRQRPVPRCSRQTHPRATMASLDPRELQVLQHSLAMMGACAALYTDHAHIYRQQQQIEHTSRIRPAQVGGGMRSDRLLQQETPSRSIGS